jgi:hypothetical protein
MKTRRGNRRGKDRKAGKTGRQEGRTAGGKKEGNQPRQGVKRQKE